MHNDKPGKIFLKKKTTEVDIAHARRILTHNNKPG